MVAERIFFNILAFLLFIIMFYRMVKKNDTNYIAILVIQATGIAFSFFEILMGKLEWTFLKLVSYIMSIALPIIVIYYENRNVNIIAKTQLLLVKINLLKNNKTQAKKRLENLISKYPNNYFAHKALAEIYETEGGMRKAIDEYVKAIDLQKDDYESYYKIADLLNSLTKKDEAVSMLQNLLKIKPNYTNASELLGQILIENKRYKEAANVYLDAIKYQPENYDLYYNLGIAYIQLNDFNRAKYVYERAAQINHLKYRASFNLGKIAIIYNDLDTAQKYFEQAKSGEEVEAMSNYELAKIQMYKKDREKAIEYLNKAIQLDENYVKKVDDEMIFVPIRAYINTKPVKNNVNRKKLNNYELSAKEHLDKTVNVVEKINDMDKKEIKIDFDKEFKGYEHEDR